MEHDEKIIREKIQQVESKTTSWNKDVVWSAIARKPENKRRRLIFYYAAASIALAIAAVVFVKERTYQKQLEIQLAQLELSIEQHQSQDLLTSRESAPLMAEEECLDAQTTHYSHSVKQPKRKSEKVTTLQQDKTTNTSSTPVQLAEYIQEPTETLTKDKIIPTEVTVEGIERPKQGVQRVAAIFGVEKATSPSDASDKKLQVRLMLMDVNKVHTSSSSEPMNILATINQK
jgi:hypothetical protein